MRKIEDAVDKLQGSRVQGLGLREANMEVEASGKNVTILVKQVFHTATGGCCPPLSGTLNIRPYCLYDADLKRDHDFYNLPYALAC